MINGNINSFLDTGWYTESTLFFNGNVYWCEATTENGLTTFFVNRWKASLTDNMYYNSHIGFFFYLVYQLKIFYFFYLNLK